MEFNWQDDKIKTTVIVKKEDDNFKIVDNITEYDV